MNHKYVLIVTIVIVLFIFIYVAVWKCYRQQGTGFKLENYITPGAHLCVSEEPENDGAYLCASEEPENDGAYLCVSEKPENDGAYLCASEKPENDSDTEYWKVYFSEVRKSNYTSALVIIILIALCCISSG